MQNNISAIDRLIQNIEKKNNPSAIGLDTVIDYLPENRIQKCKTLYDAAKYIADFNIGIIDAVRDIAPAVKIQAACYEMYGTSGIETFKNTIEYARLKGLTVIADIKRNDIGNSAKYYSAAYLGKVNICGSEQAAPFDSDFVTVNAYLGEDGIKPFIDDCVKYNKGIFVLVKTSNKGSGQFQDRELSGGGTLFECVGGHVKEWGSALCGRYGYSSVGAVVGATYREQARQLRNKLNGVFFLLPGYGAQGASADDIAVCFDKNGRGGIVNSSRAILCAYKNPRYSGLDCYTAARRAAEDMKEDITAAIKRHILLL